MKNDFSSCGFEFQTLLLRRRRTWCACFKAWRQCRRKALKPNMHTSPSAFVLSVCCIEIQQLNICAVSDKNIKLLEKKNEKNKTGKYKSGDAKWMKSSPRRTAHHTARIRATRPGSRRGSERRQRRGGRTGGGAIRAAPVLGRLSPRCSALVPLRACAPPCASSSPSCGRRVDRVVVSSSGLVSIHSKAPPMFRCVDPFQRGGKLLAIPASKASCRRLVGASSSRALLRGVCVGQYVGHCRTRGSSGQVSPLEHDLPIRGLLMCLAPYVH
jgi:hypothetical protein